ncbi:CB1 cannabinoid receptor-interacting protein 1 [Chamberlinius hualienensis]
MEHQLHFKCVMALSKEPEGHPVYFKVDGQRFRNNRTIKLHTGSAYKFNFTFKPSQVLETVNIHGSNLPVSLNESSTGEGITSSYTSVWSTENIPLTKKGQRDNVPLILKIKDKGTLKTSMQAKFYKIDDKHHCEWGNHFTNIEFECNANEHRNHVDIAKETFR